MGQRVTFLLFINSWSLAPYVSRPVWKSDMKNGLHLSTDYDCCWLKPPVPTPACQRLMGTTPAPTPANPYQAPPRTKISGGLRN